MKSFGTHVPAETIGIGFTRFAYPHGRELPRAPVQGEVFFLDVDIDGGIDRLSFERGLYICTGFSWEPFSEISAKRKSSAIGSQKIEVEVPANPEKLPKASDGFIISSLSIRPEFRRTQIAGTASFWTSLDSAGIVQASIWRDERLVSFVYEGLMPGMPRTVSISFVDSPGSTSNQVYTLKVNTDVVGNLYVNQSDRFTFDGVGQTALIAYETN